MPDTSDLESMWRGFLYNAAARQVATSKSPSADVVAGWEDGELSALAEVIGTFSGESPRQLVEEALARATAQGADPAERPVGTARGRQLSGRRRR